jgi:hypothetical protein
MRHAKVFIRDASTLSKAGMASEPNEPVRDCERAFYSNEGAFSRATQYQHSPNRRCEYCALTVLRPGPVGDTPPASVDAELKVVHHRVLEEVDDPVHDLFGLGQAAGEDGGCVELGGEVGLRRERGH